MTENRYKLWEFTIKPNGDYLPEDSLVSSVLNNVFDTYKFTNIKNESYIGCGEVLSRPRQKTLYNAFKKYCYESDYEIPKEFLGCLELKHLVNKSFDNYLLPTESGEEVINSGYSGNDIRMLDDVTNHFPWQKNIIDFLFYKSSYDFLPSYDREILWIYDQTGCTGKSKFVKWMCVRQMSKVAKISFGSSSQLKASLISAGQRKCYFIDLPRTLGKDDKLDNILSNIEDLKNGHIVSPMYGRYKTLYVDPPHIVIFSNKRCPKDTLSSDRWRMFEIKKKDLTLKELF